MDILEKIIEAKEKIGDDAAIEIAKYLGVENFDEKNLKGCCPFHHEDTPSFIWNKKDKMFKCFGCQRRYGILDMYTDIEGSYNKALEKLFERTGIKFDSRELKIDRNDFFERYRYPKEEPDRDKSNVYEYYKKRGISKETIDYAGVKEDSHKNCVFELRDLDGELLAVKYRPSHKIRDGEPKMWWQKDADTCPCLYNIDKVDITKPILFVEGYSDVLAVLEAGYKNVVSIPGGAEDLNWIEFNYELLENIEQIILWFDNDRAGEIGRKQAQQRLGEYKCKIVKPSKEDIESVHRYYSQYGADCQKTDANNILLACGKDRIINLIENAEDIPVENMIDLMDVEEFDIDKTGYNPTGIAELDKQIYGYIDGSLNIWTAYSGCGKSLAVDSDLVGENGYFKMKDVKVGDKVYGEDGELHSVTGVYPQGVLDIWEVKFSDGSSVECSKDHLWTVRINSKSKDINKGIYTKTLEDIMNNETLKYGTKTNPSKNGWNIFIPMCKPLNFSKKTLPVDPYVLGCLIGDGGFTQNPIQFYNIEKDVLNKFQSRLPDGLVLVDKGNGKDYRIRDDKKIEKSNRLTKEIDGLGLKNLNSHNKFIPEIYKMSSVDDRIELLTGLIDTDGEIRGGAYEYSTASERLIKDVQFVVNSLGGTMSYSERNTKYTNKDGTRTSKSFKSYRAYIKMPKDIKIFSSEKHNKKFKEARLNPYRSIRSIKYVGKKECQCIMVDNPSRLYLTNNCITTHNTTLIAQTCVLEAVDKNQSVFWFNAESTTSQMLNWILSQAAGRQHMIEFKREDGFCYYKPTLEAVKAIKKKYSNKIYVYDNLLLSSAEDVLNKMKYMYKKRGTKVFVLDNWLCLNFRGKSDAEITGIQVDFMNDLIHFAKKNNLQIHLVAHPRKPQANMPLTEYDILGSSNIVNMADRIYGLEKVWDDTLKPEGFDRQFTVFKDRILGVKGQRIGLRYDKVTRRLYSDTDDKYRKYSWDDGSIKYTSSNFGKNGVLVGNRKLDFEKEPEDMPY